MYGPDGFTPFLTVGRIVEQVVDVVPEGRQTGEQIAFPLTCEKRVSRLAGHGGRAAQMVDVFVAHAHSATSMFAVFSNASNNGCQSSPAASTIMSYNSSALSVRSSVTLDHSASSMMRS